MTNILHLCSCCCLARSYIKKTDIRTKKIIQGTQRVTKKNKPPQNDPNKKFLEVQKPFYKKVFGRRRHY